jgi:3-oxoacyl-[acyl-carrier-protein] synthase-3
MKISKASLYVPEIRSSNADLEARLGLESGWIERRTGIKQRPAARPEQATSDLAIEAGRKLLLQSPTDPSSIGLLLLATSTPDHLLPPTAPLVAHKLNLPQAGAIDLAGACAGFLYAMALGGTWADVMQKSVLVIGANILTRRVDPSDPATAALFSDGAGAVLVEPHTPSDLLAAHLGADGAGYDTIGIAAGGSREQLTAEGLALRRNLMTMRRGPALFRHAVHAMAEAGTLALRGAGLDPSAMDWWIPHQANARIIREAGELLEIPAERTVNVVAQYANSSAATIPIALAGAVESGCIRPGDRLLFTAAGAGMLSAALVMRWGGVTRVIP